MSQEFRLRFDQLRDNHSPSEPEPSAPPVAEESYFGPGYTRYVCFVWLDGRRLFLSYNYLIAGEFVPEQNTIALQFTSHHIMLNGARMEQLYFSLMHQMAKLVIEADPRYETLEDTNKAVVHTITVTKME